MLEQVLLIAGASIFALLGLIHLFYTFFSHKFNAFDPAVTQAMKNTSPVLTKETSMWAAWVGFNASHSLGALLVAAFYIPMAASHMALIQQSLWFSLLPSITGVSYLILAKKYWFKIPFVGILISTICFVLAFILINF